MVAIKGHFDGKVFVPDEPVNLPQGRAVILHVEMASEPVPAHPQGLWGVLQKHVGSMEAPADWSAEHDHYLYGTPKRNGAKE
jgi:hypothetical protein